VPPRARAAIEFDDGSAIFLVDSRALATLALRPRGDEAVPELGPDAASASLDAGALAPRLRSRRGAIKPALLDQRVIAGLGNIYAAESLWRARISPFARASALSEAEVGRLVAGIRDTITLAREDPGRYSRGDALDRLAVYGREGERCLRCGGTIARAVQAGRSTYFCPVCQANPAD